MAFYPLTVLVTNRVLDTVISRNRSSSVIGDLRHTWKIGGMKALYAGFVPYFLLSQLLCFKNYSYWEEVAVGESQ
jgi:hypothetical protein